MAISDLTNKLKHGVDQAVEKAGDLASQHKDKIEGAVDKAGDKLDAKTKGKYSDKVGKVKSTVHSGVEKLADHGSQGGQGTKDTPGPGQS